MKSQIDIFLSDFFKFVFLWAKESFLKSIMTVVLLIVLVPPIINQMHKVVLNFPYVYLFTLVGNFFYYNFTLSDYIIMLFVLLLFYYVHRLQTDISRSKQISDNFSKDLNLWNIPLNSAWSIQDCRDYLGKMLSISESSYPGTLKGAYGWYDYELTFLAKIPKSKNPSINILVRSENNSNGIRLCFSKKKFSPYIFFESKYYLDDTQEEKLPIILENDRWYKFRITVKGGSIETTILNQSILYKIYSRPYLVEEAKFFMHNSITDISRSDKSVRDSFNAWNKQYSLAQKIAHSDPNFAIEIEKANQLLSDIPKFKNIAFDYHKGSIGFMQDDEAKILLRNVLLKNITN